jgi:hypothetical protein
MHWEKVAARILIAVAVRFAQREWERTEECAFKPSVYSRPKMAAFDSIRRACAEIPGEVAPVIPEMNHVALKETIKDCIAIAEFAKAIRQNVLSKIVEVCMFVPLLRLACFLQYLQPGPQHRSEHTRESQQGYSYQPHDAVIGENMLSGSGLSSQILKCTRPMPQSSPQ